MIAFTDPGANVLPFLSQFSLEGRQITGKTYELAAEKIKKANHEDHKSQQCDDGRQGPGKSLPLQLQGEGMQQDRDQEGKKQRNHQGFAEPHENDDQSYGKERQAKTYNKRYFLVLIAHTAPILLRILHNSLQSPNLSFYSYSILPVK